MPDAPRPEPLSRRGFVLAASACSSASPAGGRAALARGAPERRLVIHHQHTGEWLRTVYFADGRYQQRRPARDQPGVARLAHRASMVDRPAGAGHRLLLLQQRLALAGPLEVVCGYRSPATNAMLRRRSRGVAKDSLHMAGKAIDIGFRGRDAGGGAPGGPRARRRRRRLLSGARASSISTAARRASGSRGVGGQVLAAGARPRRPAARGRATLTPACSAAPPQSRPGVTGCGAAPVDAPARLPDKPGASRKCEMIGRARRGTAHRVGGSTRLRAAISGDGPLSPRIGRQGTTA